MSEQNNGGPAFPLQSIGPDFAPGYGGMSLRDYFAAKAMHQFLHGAVLPVGFDATEDFALAAERAYEVTGAPPTSVQPAAVPAEGVDAGGVRAIVIQCPMCADFDPEAGCRYCSLIPVADVAEWKLAVEVARPVPKTGMVPVKARTILAINAALVNAIAAQAAPAAPVQAGQEVGEDTKRLDALRDNSWDLRCFDMPTGAGDADIGWRVIQHHMAKPHERTVGEAFEDDPRKAIDAALAAKGQG